MNNQSSMSAFILLEFSEVRELQILYFFVFLALYLITVTGNLLIIAAVAFDHHLQAPMYFFLTNLAVMDLGTISTIMPKSMENSLMNSRSISYFGCVAQVFFFFFFGGSDFFILTVMAYDRYVAICNPLQYERIMNKGTCVQMAAIVWICGLFYASLHTGSTFANTFCSNMVRQFFCEVPSLVKLSCSDIYLVEVGLMALSCSLGLGCFIYITITYMHIFSAVLKIPSIHGQRKAFSTCLPHLSVVSLLAFTGAFAYAKPPVDIPSDLDVAFASMYTIISPMLNPFIYSMRNREIKAALLNLLNSAHFSNVFLQDGNHIMF